jgi:hypothetical protein
MRCVLATILTSLFAVPLLALQVQQQGQQQIQQVECRDLAVPDNYLAPNETIINGKACRPAATPDPTKGIPPSPAPLIAKASASAATPTSTPAPVAPAAADQGVSAQAPAPQIAPANAQVQSQLAPAMRVPPGSVIAIAPMGGFDTYLAAALRQKKVPVILTVDPNQSNYVLVSTEYEWRGWFASSQGSAHGSANGSANWNANGGTANYNANYNANSSSHAGSTRGLEASLMLIDKQTQRVLWAYEVHKSSHGALLFGTVGMRGEQSISEACAKHLKDFIEKDKD